MSEKKNIDRLFQEKFRDFEAAPPEMTWSNIETQLLKKKKKRRVIPLWYRIGGVAAILVIGLILSMPLFNGTGDADAINGIVVEDGNGNNKQPGRIYPTKDPIQPNEVVADSSSSFDTDPTQAVASRDGISGADKLESGGNNSQQKYAIRISSPENTVASGTRKQNSQSNKIKRTTGNNAQFNNVQPEAGVAANNNHANNKTRRANIPAQNNAAVAQGGNNSNRNTIKDKNAQQPDARSNVGKLPAKEQNAIATIPQKGNENSAVENNTGIIDKNKEVVPDGSKTNETVANATVAKESMVQQPENELEKLLKEKQLGKEKEEEKALADNNAKWNIKPQMAPVFYNSIGSGSPIDSQLANNNKSYDSDLSYGLGINYAINSRISVRTGINTVNLSYSTNNIQFYAALNEQTPNIAARGTKANIVVQDQGAAGSSNFEGAELSQQKFNGSMVQKMGYIEVPLEMSYKVLNKRFGIDLIGGVSTLFLNDNNVSVVSNQGLASDMGEAQNLNNVHFSTNLGVGFRYRFWKAFEANFEPMFKYQVNTFSGDSGNFKPYFIGLYSGISFSF